jgi:hypothetical protein
MQQNGTRRTSCDRCHQLKKACHWDLVGVTGPRDPNVSKRARKTAKKPVINVDDLEDADDGVMLHINLTSEPLTICQSSLCKYAKRTDS